MSFKVVAVRNRCRALHARDITADRHASQARAAAQDDGLAVTPSAGDDDLAALELCDRLDRAIARRQRLGQSCRNQLTFTISDRAVGTSPPCMGWRSL